MMLLHDLMENTCSENATLEVLQALPTTLKLVDREREVELRNASEISSTVDCARAALKKELKGRCFTARPSNSRMVQIRSRCTCRSRCQHQRRCCRQTSTS
mmetsp:Transcript_47442/g.109115  ORF Transcript_47442/g.109115 Transcript_47442/m.109115 type:complete len:101 (-) Transcript_47442:179-481(-)